MGIVEYPTFLLPLTFLLFIRLFEVKPSFVWFCIPLYNKCEEEETAFGDILRFSVIGERM